MINILIETNFAIRDKTKVFLAGRSQYIVVESKRWRPRFSHHRDKMDFYCLVIYVKMKQHFPLIAHLLILTKLMLMSMSLVSISLIFENSDASSANILHIDFKPSRKCHVIAIIANYAI